MTSTTDDYPFPDEPNAEICTITGGRANARVFDKPREIMGWYGSTICDMTSFAVIDSSLPIGPISDGEIEKALAAGRIVSTEPMTWSDLRALPSAAVRALIQLGIDRTTDAISTPAPGELGDLPIGIRTVDDDMLAAPFIPGLISNGLVNLVGIGALLALTVHARGGTLEDPTACSAAIDRLERRIHDRNYAIDSLLDVIANPESEPVEN